jgi:hypothetical protein
MKSIASAGNGFCIAIRDISSRDHLPGSRHLALWDAFAADLRIFREYIVHFSQGEAQKRLKNRTIHSECQFWAF